MIRKIIAVLKPSKVLEKTETSFTFDVDSVQIQKERPILSTAQEVLEKHLGTDTQYEDFSHRGNKEESFVKGKIPGFILTIHTAYQDHYPLKLSVSDFIILIGQGLARHMDKYSEELRQYFVDHEGKEQIKIRRNGFVQGKQNDWSTVFGDFADEIKKRVKTDFYSIIVDDTSVATRDSRIVSEIALMDCMKGYFDYMAVTTCGIPQITLEGSVKDWENLLHRVKRLEEMNKDNCLLLDFWLKHLVPLVEKICKQAISRKPDRDFWSGIYKYSQPGSGSPYISGWSTIFLPYLSYGKNGFQNPAKIKTNEIPKQISELNFLWDYSGKLFRMKFYGGFLGAKYDKKTGTVEPVHFWAVTYNRKNEDVKIKDDVEF